MKEHEDIYVAVMGKHTLYGANTTAFVKHKHMYVVLVRSTHVDGANTVAIEFQVERLMKCIRCCGS